MCLAVPGRILSVAGDDLTRTGEVDFAGVVKQVNLACVPEAQAGNYVLVHVGVALNTVDESEAERTLEYLRQIGELAEQERPPGP